MTVAVATDRRDRSPRPGGAGTDLGLWSAPVPAAEAVFVIGALLSFAQLNVQPFRDAPTFWIAVGAVALLLARFDQLVSLLRRVDPALLALVALAPLSSIWSVDPDQTMRSGRVLLATTAVGVYVALRFDLRAQLRLVVVVLALAAAVSLAMLVVAPDQASVEDFRGQTWRGAFDTKNVFGRAMSLGAIAAASVAAAGTRRRWAYGVVALGCTALVAISWSKVALGMTVLGFLLIGAVAGIKRIAGRGDLIGLVLVGAISGALCTVGWFVSDPDAALGAVGRDATLTGRTGLWQVVLDAIGEHPIGGYGYGAFWQGFSGPSRDIWLEFPWQPPHAHNGLLELMLNLGAVGAALWLTSLVISLWRAIRWARGRRTIESLWPITVLAFIAIYNVTEVTGPQNNLFWTLYVATSLSLAVATRARRAYDVPPLP